MRVFFNSNHTTLCGPVQVNRNLLRWLGGRVSVRHDRFKPVRMIHSAWNTLRADVVIFSGLLVRDYEVRMARALGKKIIYLMHGCSFLETGLVHPSEALMFECADVVLTVSDFYGDLIRRTYTAYAYKLRTLRNGVAWPELEQAFAENAGRVVRDPLRIILMGGGRREKCNLQVCRAAARIAREDGLALCVHVFGSGGEDIEAISSQPGVTFHGEIPHSEILVELMKSGVYVQNSRFESFGLGLMDAMAMGCSLLLTKNVGALEIIPAATADDVISDPDDEDELVAKLRHVLAAPNNARLSASVDRRDTSAQASAERLLDYCRELCNPDSSRKQ